ncbi:MAG: hypothetical protein M1819_000653 [Sarea resinae]|nr:MAG: hypothetical protein M1819_000653 [Sarea resinae]
MPSSPPFPIIISCLLVLVLIARPAHAFGAGNIASTSKVEGQNWRHGDIEDTLLTLLISRAAGGKKFSKLDVKRVYFGNWLRDYSQAVDVGTVKYVSAEAIRIVLWVLGFLSFGYGTKEFEVTTERLGCYRPEEHIDNPKDYADNLDAREYDPRLRGPVDERRELSINAHTGLKNYIASEELGIVTSAGLVRNLYGRSIHLGRQYARTHNEADLYEALRLLGTANHCLEDYSAHSNYTELTLIEMGEREIFPHVGRQTLVQLQGARGPVYPIVTGTFGGVDFLHSVMGEFSDKVTQSELQELEGTMRQSGQGENTSILQDLLSQLPSGLFGGKDQAGKVDELQANAQAAQMQNLHVTPRQPEAFTKQLDEVSKQIYPILEWHDDIMQSITEAIEKIPVLPDLIEQIQDQINIFVFSLLAPFILPVVEQVKTELATGSSEIIQSSKDKQLIVFNDDHCSDPTHSMISKDHFSNILNEPAGKVASQVLKWVVPQIIACWDDERIDVNRTLNRVISGVFHHPALCGYGDDGARDCRQLMFGVVQGWWANKDEQEQAELRDQLSRDGVEQGRNHKEGVHDSGHGCGKPLGMPTAATSGSSGVIGGRAAVLGGLGQAFADGSGSQGFYSNQSAGSTEVMGGVSKFAEEAVGGGALGTVVGGLVGGVGANLLGDAFNGGGDERKKYHREEYAGDGSFTQSYTDTGRHRPVNVEDEDRAGQAQYSQTSFLGGGGRQEYRRYEQDGRDASSGYGFQESVETRPSYGGAYEQKTERNYERPGGSWESNVRREGLSTEGEFYSYETKHQGSRFGTEEGSDEDRKREHHHEHKEKHHHHHHHHHHSGSDSGSENESRPSRGPQYEDYGTESRGYGGPREADYGGDRSRYDAGEGVEYGGYREPQAEPAHRASEYPGGERDEYGDERARERPSYVEERLPEREYGERGFGRAPETEERGLEGEFQREEEYGADRGYGEGEGYEVRREYRDEY